MNVRTTTVGMTTNMVDRLMTTQSGLLDLQTQMASQKKLNKPSDDSVGMAQLLIVKQQQNRIDTYKSNISTAREQIDLMDSSLAQVIDVINRANELTLQASNETYNPNQIASIKGEIDQIKEAVINFSNTQYNGQYIFSGNNTTYPAYTLDKATNSIVYNGSDLATDAERSVEIMEGVRVPLNVNGLKIFGNYDAITDPANPTGSGLFGVLSNISNALGESPADIDAARDQLAGLKEALGTVNNVRTQYGAYSSKRLDMTEGYLDDLSLSLSEQQSSIEDLDIIDTITKLTNQNYSYQASMKATSQAMGITLLNYL